MKDPLEYFTYIDKWVDKNKPMFFRWHVAGDIPEQMYLDCMKKLCRNHPQTKFLCFTKKFHLDYSKKPKNLQVVFSAWPGLDMPKTKFRIAWMNDGKDGRIPKNAIHCPGNCENCGMCWNLSELKKDVVFDKH